MIVKENNWILVMLCQIVLGPQFQISLFNIAFNLAQGLGKFDQDQVIQFLSKPVPEGNVFFKFLLKAKN